MQSEKIEKLKTGLTSQGVTVEPYGKNKLFCYVMNDTSLFASTSGIIINTETGEYDEADNHVSWLGCFNDDAIRAVKQFQEGMQN